MNGPAGLLGNFQKIPVDSMDSVVEALNYSTDSENSEEPSNWVSAHATIPTTLLTAELENKDDFGATDDSIRFTFLLFVSDCLSSF